MKNLFTYNSLHLPLLFMCCSILVTAISELCGGKLSRFIMSFSPVLPQFIYFINYVL